MPLYALGDVEPTIHPGAFVHPEAILIGAVTLSDKSSVWPTAVLRADFGEIIVGERTSVQDGTIVHTTEEQATIIGDDCVVGHNAHMEGCTIGNGCLVGSGSVVLGGVSIGPGCVIGGKALVTENTEIPPSHIALGVPAKIRPIEDPNLHEWITFAVNEYLTNSARYRKELRRID